MSLFTLVANGGSVKYSTWERGQANDGLGGNAWDDGRQGNYWSDYHGADVDGDGLGDTPYAILSLGLDRHPLMAPLWK